MHEDLGREKKEKKTIETFEKKNQKRFGLAGGTDFFKKKFHLTRTYGAN